MYIFIYIHIYIYMDSQCISLCACVLFFVAFSWSLSLPPTHSLSFPRRTWKSRAAWEWFVTNESLDL